MPFTEIELTFVSKINLKLWMYGKNISVIKKKKN